ncbi:MAG TPA: tetratricopeptide repeat protein, partial [Urbifossiella sp.]|nr:tetratricopeptide repeat protein [Urbifossiella sp.]
QLGNVANPQPGPDGQPNAVRAKVLARVKARPPAKTAEDVAANAADLIRLGNGGPIAFADQALNPLFRYRGGRQPSYFALTTLAALHATRGEWKQAEESHAAALFDAEMPAAVKGWSAPQRDWLRKFDDTYLLNYYRFQRTESELKPRPPPEAELPTPLFPVRFVNDAGVYEPGALAAAERAKLPPDATAVVQQMLQLFPGDTRLLWLLAELYAADGKLDEAITILDECAWSRQYGNRVAFMEHRAAIRAAIDARPKPVEEELPISLRTIFIYFGVVVVVGVVAVVRALRKGGPRAGCGPFGCG